MAYNSVVLKKYVDIQNEWDAAGAIFPGMLVELTSAGKVQAHSSAGGNAAKDFAKENALEGEGIDDAFAATDKVQVLTFLPGEEVYGILADGENVAIGDFLESNGAGYLQKHTAGSAGVVEYPNAIVGRSLEAKDLSGRSGAESSGALGYNKRIKVQIV